MKIENMTEEWVSLWYQCLVGNMDYFSYCCARSEGNVQQQKDLELQFEHIAEIYEDFGDVDIFTEEGMRSASWREWYDLRRHLFIADVKSIDRLDDKQVGHIILDVPMSKDLEQTKSRISMFLDKFYQENEIDPALEPKYKLHRKANGHLSCGIQAVRNACIVQRACYKFPLDPNDNRYDLRFREALEAFIRHEHDRLDWQFHPKAKAAFSKSGRLTQDDFERFKKNVNVARRGYKKLASNVLRKRFPDLSPFASNILDNFSPES